MNTRSPAWSGYGGCDNNILEDYYNNDSLVMASQQSTLPHDAPYYSAGEAFVAYHRRSHAREERELLHPQPGSVPRAMFMTGNDNWRRPSVATYSDESIGSPTTSSSWSHGHSTPDIIQQSHTRSSSILPDDISHTCGGSGPLSRHDSHASMTCIALPQVQLAADSPGTLTEVHSYGSPPTWPVNMPLPYTADEGYVPMGQDQGQDDYTPDPYLSTSNSSEYQTQGTSRDISEEAGPVAVNIRRRAPSSSTVTSRRPSATNTKVTKRPQHKRNSSSYHSKTSASEANEGTDASAKKFPCSFAVYGCSSAFGSKNEWKRHISRQHLRPEYWRCLQCADAHPDRKPNDFNRKDLFVQHVRRMHPLDISQTDMDEEQYLAAEVERCHITLRRVPERSRCLLCDRIFQGSKSWEERMEHVARHFDDTKGSCGASIHEPQRWNVDYDLEQYLLDEHIIVHYEGQLVLREIARQRE